MSIKKYTVVTVILLGILFIILSVNFQSESFGIDSFKLLTKDNPQLTEDLEAHIEGDIITLEIPENAVIQDFKPTIKYKGKSLKIDGWDYSPSNLPVVYLEKQKLELELANKQTSLYTLYVIKKGEDEGKILDFKLSSAANAGLGSDIACTFNGNKISAYVPSTADVTKLIPTFFVNKAEVYSSGIRQISGITKNNFSKEVKYTVKTKNQQNDYYVEVIKLKDESFPNVFIYNKEFDNNLFPSRDKDSTFAAKFTITNSLNGAFPTNEYKDLDIEIKLRGNSSLEFPKKNYSIKFEDDVTLCGMAAEKAFVLVSNYCDKTLMRNKVGYELASRLSGLGFTPKTEYVNLFLNGEYWGSYLLTEQITIDKNRLDIKKLTAESQNITGGYLLEVCERRDKENMIYPGGYPLSVKSPNENDITEEQKEYIKQYFEEMLAGIQSGQGYEKYIDIDSFIDWYLCNEIMKTLDASGYASIFLNKDADSPLKMGPVWDFDISSGNTDYQDPYPNNFWILNSTWFVDLVNNTDFYDRVCERWNEIKDEKLFTILNYINETEKLLQNTQADNFERWDILGVYVWPNNRVLDTYAEEVDYLRSWMTERLEWLDDQFEIE